MDEETFLAQRFETHRTHLRSVAYRMLGSQSEADDAVQEAWIRLSRSDADSIDNLGGWLTTVVGRVSLNMLRSRRSRPATSLDTYVPDPIVTRDDGIGPEQAAILADSVGLALQVVLDMLAPAERLAFVLHDMFAVPFDEIATIIDRSPEATRQLASRARRRVQGADATPDGDVTRHRAVVDAFFAAARGGDFDALVALLDPDVALRSDGGEVRAVASSSVRGAKEVASRAIMFSHPDAVLRPVLVNGAAGVVVVLDGEPFGVMAFTVRRDRITEIDVLVDPDRIRDLDLSALDA